MQIQATKLYNQMSKPRKCRMKVIQVNEGAAILVSPAALNTKHSHTYSHNKTWYKIKKNKLNY